MAFTFYKDKGQEDIGEQKPIRPFRAFAREGATSLAGTYGDILSLIPGYQAGQPTQATQQQISKEAQAQGPEFLRQILANAAQPDIINQTGTFPSSEQVSSFLDMLGIPKQEEADVEKFAGRFGRLSGGGAALTGNIPLSISTGLTGGLGGYLAEKAGFGPTGQAVAEFVSSLRGRKPTTKVETGKISQPRAATKALSPKEQGFLTPERLTKQLNKVNEEAAEISKTIGKENKIYQAVSKSIEAGEPILKRFDQAFRGLEDTARQFNPPINAETLNNFLKKEAQQYAKTGAPTDLSKFVNEQIKGWSEHGEDLLFNMMRRYRLNNERIGEIFRREPSGKTRNQMIHFLTEMNNSIADSFRNTFSQKSPKAIGQTNLGAEWLNAFEETNRAYSSFLNTQKARSILEPLSKKELSDADLSKFLKSERTWEDLNRFLGVEESGKLKTLLEDMQTAKSALKNISVKEVAPEILKNFLLHQIPGLGKISNFLSLPKIWNWAKGRFYSSPEFTESFHEFAEALKKKNLPAATNALKNISSAKEEKKKEKESALPFTFFPLQKK